MSVSLESSAEALDKYDTIPIVSTLFSAPLRAGIALVQIVVGTFFGILGAADYYVSGNDRFWHVSKANFREVRHGFENLSRAFIAFVPIIGNLILANRTSKVVLTRDEEGYYTIPAHAKIPGVGFGQEACLRSKEFLFKQGDKVYLDTKAKILPPGWSIQN